MEEDCDDIWRGVYPELLGITGVMGEKGERGMQREERGEIGTRGEANRGSMPLVRGVDIQKLRFYPLDPSLPPVVKLKLQCKEINFLIEQLQKSLVKKMTAEHTLSGRDKNSMILNRMRDERQQQDKAYEDLLKQNGLKRLEDGRVVKDE